MSKSTSAFLDLLRLVAALIVFVDHCAEFWYPQASMVLGKLGHGAVVVFFVLSGYVITYSTTRNGFSRKGYVLGRLSRLYSVVLPAILLSLLLDKTGSYLNPEFYLHHNRGYEFLRYTLTSLYLQNIWLLNACPPTNGPFWSLSYEFWYYAFFGVATLITGLRFKIILLVLIALLVGPNIILLMPCWLLGVLLYVLRRKTAMPFWPAFIGFVISATGTLLLTLIGPEFPFPIGSSPLFYSGSFITDWVAALLLAATIWFFDSAFRTKQPPNLLCAGIQSSAGHTFSLYLYHYPLLAFVAATLRFESSNPYQAGIVILSVLAVVFMLSLITESQRSLWWRGFERLFGWNKKPSDSVVVG